MSSCICSVCRRLLMLLLSIKVHSHTTEARAWPHWMPRLARLSTRLHWRALFYPQLHVERIIAATWSKTEPLTTKFPSPRQMALACNRLLAGCKGSDQGVGLHSYPPGGALARPAWQRGGLACGTSAAQLLFQACHLHQCRHLLLGRLFKPC